MELLISVAITVVLLSILFNMTLVSSQALDKAKTKVLLSKKADIVFDQLREDVQSMVIRNDSNEWFYAGVPLSQHYGAFFDSSAPMHVQQGVTAMKIGTTINEFAPPNICSMYFYSAALDKYDGYAGTPVTYGGNLIDSGGDVCMVEYKLNFRSEFFQLNGIDDRGFASDKNNKWLFFRNLMHPDEAYKRIGAVDANGRSKTTRQAYFFGTHGSGINNSSGARHGLESVLATRIYSFGATFNVEYQDDSGNTIRDYIILRPNTSVSSNGTPVTTTIRRTPAPSGSNRTFTPNQNVATLLRINGSKGVIANCPKLFSPGSTAGMNSTEVRAYDHWTPKPGVHNVKIVSADFTVILLDEQGENYLRKLNAGTITAHMRQDELLDQHGYAFSTNVKFPEY